MNRTNPHDPSSADPAWPAGPVDEPQAGLSEQGQDQGHVPDPDGASGTSTTGRAAVWLAVHRERLRRWRRRQRNMLEAA